LSCTLPVEMEIPPLGPVETSGEKISISPPLNEIDIGNSCCKIHGKDGGNHHTPQTNTYQMPDQIARF